MSRAEARSARLLDIQRSQLGKVLKHRVRMDKIVIGQLQDLEVLRVMKDVPDRPKRPSHVDLRQSGGVLERLIADPFQLVSVQLYALQLRKKREIPLVKNLKPVAADVEVLQIVEAEYAVLRYLEKK